MVRHALLAGIALIATAAPAETTGWPAPVMEAVPGAGPYVPNPHVFGEARPDLRYRAIFDATMPIAEPGKTSPVLERIAVQLNGLAFHKVPKANIDFLVIFHGPAADAVLIDAKYRAKHGVANPNVALVDRLQKAGVKFLICGQYMAHANLHAEDLLPGLQMADAATTVLIRYGNDGYTIIPN